MLIDRYDLDICAVILGIYPLPLQTYGRRYRGIGALTLKPSFLRDAKPQHDIALGKA